MNIVLICPSFFDMENNVVRLEKATLPPASLYYLASFVPKEHNVTVLNDQVTPVDFDIKADLVGITSATSNIRRAYAISEEFRKRGVKTVIGGIHVSALPDEALQYADSVVIGETEDIWPKIIEDAAQGKLQRRYQGGPRDSLVGLPQPRFDMIDHNRYMILPGATGPMIPIQTARGCPHGCDFCTVTKFWGRKMRYRPIDEVVAEIKNCRSNMVFFTDDNFFANPKRAVELCEALKPLKLRFFCQIDTIVRNREQAIKLMGEAGCIGVYVGFERIDTSSLGSINKSFNKPDEYAHLIKLLHKAGIVVYASLIWGLRGDTMDSVKNTVKFLIKHKVDVAGFWPITPYPGTAFFDNSKADGSLLDDQWWMHEVQKDKEALIKYPENPFTEYELARESLKKFYTWPSVLRRSTRLMRYPGIYWALNIASIKRLKGHGNMHIL